MRPCPHCAALEADVARLTAEKEHAARCCLGQLDAKLAREKELIEASALVRELAAALSSARRTIQEQATKAARNDGIPACQVNDCWEDYLSDSGYDALKEVNVALCRAEAEAGEAR